MIPAKDSRYLKFFALVFIVFLLAAATIMGPIIVKSLNNIRFASQFPGSNWCAQVMAADADLGAVPGTVVLDNSVASMSTCSLDIAQAASHRVLVTQGGTYVLGTHEIKPAGANTGIWGSGWDTIFSYTGTSWAAIIDTEPNTNWRDFQIQIVGSGTLASSALGGVKVQHVTSTSEANNRFSNVRVLSTGYTVGQIGWELYTTALSDSNYNNRGTVFSFLNDIGLKLVSASAAGNSSNRNTLSIDCLYASRCVQIPDGTDNNITASSSGSCTLGSRCAGPAYLVELGGTGGGVGASNNVIHIGADEQGSNSGPMSILSGAAINTFDGMPNDPLPISDTSGVLTNRGTLAGIMYNPTIAGTTASLCWGGVNSSGNPAWTKSGTTLQAKLCDGSADATAQASRFFLTQTTGTAPMTVVSTTPVANLTASQILYSTATGTQATNAHEVQAVCTLGTNCAVTLSNGAVFTSSATYDCFARDATTPANAVTIAISSGAAVTFTGTGTDSIHYWCRGN